MFDPAAIPGMIEPVEQQMLTELASQVAEGEVIVEFGCFFGRSTACLVNGSYPRWSQARTGPVVFAFDSFACRDSGAFAPQVQAFAKPHGVEHLVRREAGRLDFHPVYQHFVGTAENAGLLKTTVAELRDATFDGGRIALMHIDAPKYYEELKYVLFRFFPALTPGGGVVFQDYLYHWSATLIAATQLLVEAGVLRFERSAATAILARVLRAPSPADLLALDLAMASTPVADLIDRAVATVKTIAIDRPEQFVPRLHLAKVQYLWERGEFAAAQGAFMAMIQATGGKLGGSVFADFQELMRYGFSIRTLYERDH